MSTSLHTTDLARNWLLDKVEERQTQAGAPGTWTKNVAAVSELAAFTQRFGMDQASMTAMWMWMWIENLNSWGLHPATIHVISKQKERVSEAKGPIQEGVGLQPGSVRRSHAIGCTPHHILCHFKTVRRKVQPIHPPHMWGRELVTHLVNPYLIGNKHAKLQSVARSSPQAPRDRRYVSGGGNQTRTAGTSSPTPTAPLLVFKGNPAICLCASSSL